MPTLLIATPEGGVVRRVPLDPAHAYWLGRSPRCDVALEPRSISRRHALLFPHGGSWWVADAGSTRGLRTAEGPTRFAPLTVERWISIGPLALWLLPTTDRSRSEPDPPAFGMAPAPDDPLNDSIDAEALSPSEAEPSHLLALESTALPDAGRAAGRLIDLADVQHATVGSDVACAIRVEGSEIAPLHAVVVREPRGWSIVGAQGAITSAHERYLRKRLEAGVVVQLGASVGGCAVRIVEPERLKPAAQADLDQVHHTRSPIAPAKPSTFLHADDAA